MCAGCNYRLLLHDNDVLVGWLLYVLTHINIPAGVYGVKCFVSRLDLVRLVARHLSNGRSFVGAPSFPVPGRRGPGAGRVVHVLLVLYLAVCVYNRALCAPVFYNVRAACVGEYPACAALLWAHHARVSTQSQKTVHSCVLTTLFCLAKIRHVSFFYCAGFPLHVIDFFLPLSFFRLVFSLQKHAIFHFFTFVYVLMCVYVCVRFFVLVGDLPSVADCDDGGSQEPPGSVLPAEELQP